MHILLLKLVLGHLLNAKCYDSMQDAKASMELEEYKCANSKLIRCV